MATRIEIKEVPITRVEKVETIILEMTREDASVLLRVFDRIGGSPEGYRGNIDKLRRELTNIGILRNQDISFRNPNISLYFEDNL